MKALTLWQPWGSLIAWGEKQYETRSWSTPYRGPLAIHAGLVDLTPEFVPLNIFYRRAFARHGENGANPEALPHGKILCIVDLVHVERTEDIKPWLSASEEAFGDYSTGRFAWQLDNLRVLAEPIPARGRQGLWEWPMELASLVFREDYGRVTFA